ncbi:MAG TPA: aldehyde dehydrogenase family protein [Phycisphaerales bacterium]|nr:aldehyde dehydrogenase family protein [Phycisphaerales bacterium]
MSKDLLSLLNLRDDPRFVSVPPGTRPGVTTVNGKSVIVSENPATGEALGAVTLDSAQDLEREIAASVETFKTWREVPAPQRGLLVRALGDEFRKFKEPLGELVSLEMGKIRAEGLGEVQETIDIADYAVGLSRQLPGQVFPSERPGHRMFEQWLPLGPIGIITAFNFPNAVWGWNAMLGAVCGDVCIWKPSLLTPLITLATHRIAERVAARMNHPGVFRLLIGTDDQVGERLVNDRRVPLISATGSCRMGRRVGSVVAQRLGRALLELGGNNALIVHEDADLNLAIPAIVFGAVGTAGQRCTTTRRLIVHEKVLPAVLDKLVAGYKQVSGRIGDPLKDGTLIGPLINEQAVAGFLHAIEAAKRQGGEVLAGGGRVEGAKGHFVQPTIIRAPGNNELAIAREETFAPILYVFSYKTIDQAIAMQNGVDQGLSSAVFTESLRVSERFLSTAGAGSDCGIANVNIGTSGAEIGGAFGGEKDTGGGRESGSDSWKAYMRRQTCTVNYAGRFELAQGIRFE